MGMGPILHWLQADENHSQSPKWNWPEPKVSKTFNRIVASSSSSRGSKQFETPSRLPALHVIFWSLLTESPADSWPQFMASLEQPKPCCWVSVSGLGFWPKTTSVVFGADNARTGLSLNAFVCILFRFNKQTNWLFLLKLELLLHLSPFLCVCLYWFRFAPVSTPAYSHSLPILFITLYFLFSNYCF